MMLDEAASRALFAERDDLVAALRRVLGCRDCKSRGTIWVRGAPDKRCACRSDAFRLLREIEE